MAYRFLVLRVVMGEVKELAKKDPQAAVRVLPVRLVYIT
jgi:hypothetical protein